MADVIGLEKKLAHFQYRPLFHLDESWLNELPECHQLSVIPLWRENATLNQYFIQHYQDSLVLQTEQSSLLQLEYFSSSDLYCFLKILGAVLHGHAIQKIVLKNERQKLIECLDKQVYQFASTQFRFLLKEWPTDWSMELPKVGWDEHYFVLSGLRFLMVFVDNHRKIPQHLFFKLPYTVYDSYDKPLNLKPGQRVLANLFIKKIVKRMMPQCFHLFE